jgi:hypothetical protein
MTFISIMGQRNDGRSAAQEYALRRAYSLQKNYIKMLIGGPRHCCQSPDISTRRSLHAHTTMPSSFSIGSDTARHLKAAVVFSVPLTTSTGNGWRWRSSDGTADSAQAFSTYGDCLEDAIASGYRAITLIQPAAAAAFSRASFKGNR